MLMKNNFQWKWFQLWMYIKTLWIWMDWNARWNQFMLQILQSIPEITEIIQELKLNKVLAEVTKLLRLILTIPATYASCERLSSSLKHLSNYMRYSESERRLSNLVCIFMNKDFLKKIKVNFGLIIFLSDQWICQQEMKN